MRPFSSLIVLTIFSLSLTALAQSESTIGTIRQVFIEQNRVIGEITTAAVATNDFVITFEDKSQCVLKAVERRERLVSLDLSSCAQKNNVKAGMIFEPSLLFGAPAALAAPAVQPPEAPVIAQPPAAAPTEAASSLSKHEPNRVRFAMGLAIGISPTATFTEGTNSTTNLMFETEFKFNGGTTLHADVRSTPKHDWGFIGAISHDISREISSVKYTSGNSSVTYNSSGSKLSVTMVEFSFAYRWNEFYLPLGLNYSHFRFLDDSFAAGYELRGGLGAQIGFGYYISEQFALELWSRATNLKFKIKSGGITEDYGRGIYSSATLGFKALF